MKTTKLITGLLALLGFAACNNIGADMYGPGRVEYGSPYADFELKGKVTDEAGNPVKDIKIVLKPSVADDHEIATARTDAAGEYTVKETWYGVSSFAIAAEDVDGAENGGDFATETRTIEFKSSDFVGGSGWYDGKATKTADFTLELKPEGSESE